MEAPGQTSVVELWRPTLPVIPKQIKGDKTYVEAPGPSLSSPNSGPAQNEPLKIIVNITYPIVSFVTLLTTETIIYF